MEDTKRGSQAGSAWAIVAVVGAAAAGLGSYLTWLRADSGIIGIPGGRILDEVSGWDLVAGVVVLVCAALAAILALLWLAMVRAVPLAAAGLIVTGIAIVVSAAYVLVTPAERFIDWAASSAANPETTSQEIRELLPRFFETNDVNVSAQPGLYVTLAGGALVLLAGVIAMVISRRRSFRAIGAVKNSESVGRRQESSPEAGSSSATVTENGGAADPVPGDV